jgi:HK97 family phage major capsid protein
MATSIELRQQRATAWARAQEINDAAEARGEDLTAEERASWDAAMADIDGLNARIERQERLERQPAAGTEPGLPVGARPESGEQRGSAEERQQQLEAAFRVWLRSPRRLTDEQRTLMESHYQELGPEQRALSVASDTAGGFLVPDGFRAQIESAEKAFGGMLEVASTLETETGANLAIPTDNDTESVGERIGENAEVSESDPTVGQRVFGAHLYSSKMVRVPITLLQDAAFDLESWLAEKLGTRVARKLNQDFTVGVGPDGPKGIVQDAVSGVTAAATGAVTADELMDLVYSVDRAYRSRGRWMMHDQTVRDIRKLKDGDGRYIWVPGLTSSTPDTILSYGFTTNNDMGTMATGVKSVLFGDLRKYLIRNVRGFQLLVLRERFATQGQVAFLGFSRHDGALLDAGTNPVKCITQA